MQIKWKKVIENSVPQTQPKRPPRQISHAVLAWPSAPVKLCSHQGNLTEHLSPHLRKGQPASYVLTPLV